MLRRLGGSSKNIKVLQDLCLPPSVCPRFPFPRLQLFPASARGAPLIIASAGMWIGHLTSHLHQQLEGCPERQSVRQFW